MASRLIVLAKELGFKGLFRGLGPRIVSNCLYHPGSLLTLFLQYMTSFLVAGQFAIYGEVKKGAGLPHDWSTILTKIHSSTCSTWD